MEILNTASLNDTQKAAVFQLWNVEYPSQLAFPALQDFENYLRVLHQPTHLLVVDENADVCGWAFSFEREEERWFAIIIHNTAQRTGLGTRLLSELKNVESVLNGWVSDHSAYKKMNGESYHSPIQFYVKNGFEICADVRLETDKLSAVKIKWPGT
ncbi:MAG: GNAT family N-acetyltransferase [Chitinophagaceae bacterium]|jgi:GNAT superfamily N-acetyltransferase